MRVRSTNRARSSGYQVQRSGVGSRRYSTTKGMYSPKTKQNHESSSIPTTGIPSIDLSAYRLPPGGRNFTPCARAPCLAQGGQADGRQEDTGCVGGGYGTPTGWGPRPVLLYSHSELVVEKKVERKVSNDRRRLIAPSSTHSSHADIRARRLGWLRTRSMWAIRETIYQLLREYIYLLQEHRHHLREHCHLHLHLHNPRPLLPATPGPPPAAGPVRGIPITPSRPVRQEREGIVLDTPSPTRLGPGLTSSSTGNRPTLVHPASCSTRSRCLLSASARAPVTYHAWNHRLTSGTTPIAASICKYTPTSRTAP